LDQQADEWRAWLERHGPAALLFARQIAACSADAEDAVQEGFLRFWRHRAASRDPAALLYTCVRTAALDGRRSAGRRKRRETLVIGERPAWFDGGAGDDERRETTEKALRQLSEEQRAVVVLKIWGGLTLEQVAAALSEPMGTVASRYRSALQKMAGALRPEVCDG
jgi:RNA polymerase sigma-70 factor (ECF subfamily)